MENKTIIYVKADYREYTSRLPAILADTNNTLVTKASLSAGDYLVNDNFLIERKTLIDFVASIKNGRLFSQMLRLTNAGKKCALLLEGTGVDLAGSGMKREAIQGALIYITLNLNIPVLRAKDTEESAKMIQYIAQQLEQPDDKKAIVKRYRNVKRNNKQKKQLYLLQGLPGIGPERAKALLDQFGSIQKMVQASEKELQKVPGIGKYTARQIRWILEEPPELYGNLHQIHTNYPMI